MSFCNDYDFELDKVSLEIRSRKARRILIQLPEGLQQCIPFIVSKLKESLPDIEIFATANPSYGACLVDVYSAQELRVDLVIHFGHLPYPTYSPPIPVLYIAVEYVASNIEKLLAVLTDICTKYRNVCLATTAQHVRLVNKAIDIVSSRCSSRIEFRGIVLGCRPVPTDNCDLILVVAGGTFHCISQALGSRDSCLVLCYDPYTYTLWNPGKEVEKLLRVRLWKVFQARDARRWLIVDGMYGQSRPSIVSMLTGKLRALGREVYVVKMLRVDVHTLRNLNLDNFDAIVIASCPRIAIDDLSHIEKPVLTPGEALMIIENCLDRYRYPW